jgi:PAS domain S-box-containing protein
MPESRLRTVVDTTVDGIMLMDADGTVTVFNPGCERMFGYAAAEVVGGDVERLMPPQCRGEHDRRLDNDRRTGQRKIISIGGEVVGRRKNGETFAMDLSVGEAEQDGKVFYVGFVRDITGRKRAEDIREQFIEQLAASNEERGYFVHVASHDLREPLRMVAAFCGLLSKDYGERLDERGREYLALAVTATTQMRDLLDDLVDYGHPDLEAERGSRFDSNDGLDQALENLSDPIKESGAEVTREGLPRVYGNPIRFHRLMQNLVGNALKYVAPGVTPRIHVRAAPEGGFWRFSVSDNGIGIEPQHYDRIFEPFKRLHAKGQYQGTGLGLAICRKIVEGFGGVIEVSSVPGEGSIFSFTLEVRGEEGADGRRYG